MGLVIIACVARVVVMCFVVTFFVLRLMFGVLGALVALLGGVLALRPMHQAWHECLVAAIRRGFVLPSLVVFVVVVMMTVVIVVLPHLLPCLLWQLSPL